MPNLDEYQSFLEKKKKRAQDCGFEFEPPSFLYPFQKDIVKLALKKGRFAMFEDCGLGKTPQQLVWADAVSKHTDAPVLILAPLAVSEQTKREGDKFGLSVNVAEKQSDIKPGINITNYEKLHHFISNEFGGLVLDESGILKNYGGHYRKEITDFVSRMRFRLACSATPAPNELIEIINHSEFLGVLSGKEAIALFFKTDGNTTHSWRLKGHARKDFWKWMSTWAIACSMPSDLGYDDGEFILPPLNIIQHTVAGHIEDGYLFQMAGNTMQERRTARKESKNERVKLAAELANDVKEPWVIWCGLNAESDALKKAIPDAVEIKGSDSPEHKRDAMLGFSEGKYRVIISKPSISGWGMNWQHCNNMNFVGLSDSFEELYQGIRRCYRFGQKKTVNVHLTVADTEGNVLENVKRKESESRTMMRELAAHLGSDYRYQRDDDRYNGIEHVKQPEWMKRKTV